jgi:MFS family permease
VTSAAATVLAALVPSRAILTRALLACFATTAAFHLAMFLLNALLPLHVTAMGGTKTQVGLLFSVTTLVGMVLRPAVGGWADRHGARRVIVPGALLLLATSLAFHAASAPAMVIVVMAGIGVSASLITTPASVHVAEVSPPAHRGEALGTYYLFSSLPNAVAPPLALALFRSGGVGLGFAVVSVMALTIAALSLALVPRPRRTGPVSPLPFRPFSRRALGLAGVLVLVTCGHSAIYGFVPLYAIERGQDGLLGWFFGVYAGWLIACRVLLRSLSDRIGRRQALVPAIAMLVVGHACLALPPTTGSLIAAALCLASGGSLLYPTLIALVADRTPPAERGLAIGTISGAWDVGIVIGSAVVGFVVERAGYAPGFLVGAATAAAGLLVFVASERRRAPGASAPSPAGGRASR